MEDRKHMIGGSDIAAILGISKFKSRLELYYEKKGFITPPEEDTAPQKWGKLLERVIRDEYERLHNVKVHVPYGLTHPQHPYLKAHLDGYIYSKDELLEIKCANAYSVSEWGEPGSDFIPPAYLVQVAYYCVLSGARRGHIAVLIGGNEYREYTYERDRELEGYIIEAAVEFWDCLEADRHPPALNMEEARLKYLQSSHRKSLIVTPEISEIYLNILNLKEKEKSLKKELEKQKYELMMKMKDAEYIVNIDGKPLVSWKTNKKGHRPLIIRDKSM